MKNGAVIARRPPSQKNGLILRRRWRRAVRPARPQALQRGGSLIARAPAARSRHDQLTRQAANPRKNQESPMTARRDHQYLLANPAPRAETKPKSGEKIA